MNYSLRRVPAAGGEPEPLPVTLDQGEEGVVAYPALLPGDGGALVTLRRQGLGRRDPRVAVYSFETGAVQVLTEGTYGAPRLCAQRRALGGAVRPGSSRNGGEPGAGGRGQRFRAIHAG